ncbi:MAG: GrpB family protein [Verrucomicrobiales bacterium]|nr:GrpB family protein [Verrucomicrobiales bacterium]
MRTIEVVPYNPNWPALFEVERLQIFKALVSSLIELDEKEADLVALGYEAKGEFGIERRRYFQKGGNERSHQIHAFATGDPHVFRHLAFRDYLKAHPEILKEYETLKIRVAESCDNDIESYCEGKDAFIKNYEAIALEWVNNAEQIVDDKFNH